MLAWIILLSSGLLLSLMFFRQLRLTWRDLRFQKNMAEEEAVEKEIAAELEDIDEEVLDEMGTMDKLDTKKSTRGARPIFMKGDMHFSRGEMYEAQECLLAVIELDPSHLDAHHKLGMLFMKLEDFPSAELYFSKLTNLKKDPVYFSNLGAALYQQQRLVEAAEAYENAIAMDDKRGARLQSLAQVYYELDDDENALKYFELAARRKPKDVKLKMILADYYERLKRFEEASEILKIVLEHDPYNKDAKAMLKSLPH